ncbi:MAG: hypothetical protein C0483_11100 [Pirellula sp.]|nr:hypothetical protein [Pirellula sp.]
MKRTHLAPVLVTGCCAFLLLTVIHPARACPEEIARGHRLGIHTQPSDAKPTFGHALDDDLAQRGWLALFDGETTFGWSGATVADGALSGGRSTTAWPGRIEIRADVTKPGRLVCGQSSLTLPVGKYSGAVQTDGVEAFELVDGLRISALAILPEVRGLDEATWRVIKHPRNPKAVPTQWTFADGSIRAVGGPGCVELQADGKARELGDFVLQAEVTTHRPLTNGGIFFRAIAGDFMNGYEAQVFNGCLKEDPAQPSTWSTGAIDDRMNARRLVSRDGTPFSYTIHASGRHIAVWINGFQQVDWTDDRPEDDNARKGRRTKSGALQLQAHDPETDVEFANIRVQSLDAAR